MGNRRTVSSASFSFLSYSHFPGIGKRGASPSPLYTTCADTIHLQSLLRNASPTRPLFYSVAFRRCKRKCHSMGHRRTKGFNSSYDKRRRRGQLHGSRCVQPDHPQSSPNPQSRPWQLRYPIRDSSASRSLHPFGRVFLWLLCRVLRRQSSPCVYLPVSIT